ncbi:MAG: 5-formyltetrahydrofolate cyclo-ligase [Clostridia bacterium]|nr:5-formyltetrahydrofolate cyclo-ligase [Clostridia bacterium]
MLAKSEIRSINKIRRSSMEMVEVRNKSFAATREFLSSEIYKNAGEIMLYMPIYNEIDTAGIMKAAIDEGKKVVLPVTDKGSGSITPYYVAKDTKFVKGAFSVAEPYGATVVDPPKIDVVLLPGIAFDLSGNRVGFGKGCYDRFLENSKAIKIGFCYHFQISEEIEAEGHDIKMDFLLTEKGLIKCK